MNGAARREAPRQLIRRLHKGPVLVAVPGGSPPLPAVRSAEQVRAQLQRSSSQEPAFG